jgi:hypothetical protein
MLIGMARRMPARVLPFSHAATSRRTSEPRVTVAVERRRGLTLTVTLETPHERPVHCGPSRSE